MQKRIVFITVVVFYVIVLVPETVAQKAFSKVSASVMEAVYNEVKTPFKYGLVLVPDNDTKMVDSPSVFRNGEKWFMTYIVFDGTGYETWLAESNNLLDWKTTGKLMAFSDESDWDRTQKAGYIALQDTEWGGTYEWQPFQNQYWMSYLGGDSKGYEAGLLSVGIAFSATDPAIPHEWHRLEKPVLKSTDNDVRWWENKTIYKSTVIEDESKLTGHRFVMYYNAKGDSLQPDKGAERIGMAVSDDMVNWLRFGEEPVLNHHHGITGDAFIQKIDSVYVMFYFGAFWQNTKGAFDRFACSTDLVNWTDWNGENLVHPSEDFDSQYAHKPYVIKWNGVVYHFYCAVNNKNQRGIAVATSVDLGKSKIRFKE